MSRKIRIARPDRPILVQKTDHLIGLPLNLTDPGCLQAKASRPLRAALLSHGLICLTEGCIKLSVEDQLLNLGIFECGGGGARSMTRLKKQQGDQASKGYGYGKPLVRPEAMLTVPEDAQPISARIIVR